MPDTILFLSDPLNERRVDPEFADEWAALRWADVSLALVDIDQLVNHDLVYFRNLPTEGRVLYRGWMLSVTKYNRMVDMLEGKGLTPVTNHIDYWHAHHIPMWLNYFEKVTPRTRFVRATADADEIRWQATMLHADAFVVKDFVKSRKHEWDTAAYAPNLDALPGVVREFERLQGEFLVGDIVIREFVNLDKTTPEYRIWWTGKGNDPVIGLHPDYKPEQADVTYEMQQWIATVLQPLVNKFDKPFIVTDIAHKADGTWLLIEVGDAQVSGLPQGMFTDDAGIETYQQLIKAALTPNV